MQKVCLFLASSLFIFLFSFNTSFAKDLTQEVAASDSAQKTNYELPYPGLLPDSPLYFLRIMRDKTISFLISDPLKKAEFNLLQADKRLNAGIFLFNKNKILLVLSTISKAENYFGEALEKTKEARKEGMDITNITRKLMDSSKKHQEILDSLEKRSPQNFKANFKFQEKRSADFQKEVNSLTSKR